MFNKSIGGVATTAPTDTTYAAAKKTAHGTVGRDSRVHFALDAAKTVTLYIYQPIANKWMKRDGTITAGADTICSVEAPQGCPFFIVIDATTANCWVYDEGTY
jgi:hypothetical protein